MSTHSLADAQQRLAELIDRALGGEDVVISRDGRPAVALKPVPADTPRRALSQTDIEWLDRHRVGTRMPKEDAGTLVSRLRDEDWE